MKVVKLVRKIVVGPKGQITIPKEMREKYRMHEGEEIVIVPSDDCVIVRRRSSLRGKLKGKIDIKGFEKDIQEIRKQWNI